MALPLPTELIQSILHFTDTETYHSARFTSRHWYNAASTPYMLRKALEQTPTLLPALNSLSETNWNTLFNQVSQLNLFEYRLRCLKTISKGDLPQGSTASTPLATSHDGKKIVVLKGSQITIHDHNDEEKYELTLSQSLYPLWTSVCRALLEGGAGYGANQGYARHRLAVSSRSGLVAVGLGKTIQIYNYRDPGSPVEYVLGQTETVFSSSSPAPGPNYRETDGVVESLEFVDGDGDMLLRVGIGKESNPNRTYRVRYLGDPSRSSQQQPSLYYWRQNLNRVYLDSVALATILPNNDYKTALNGIHLLPQSPSTTSRSFIAALKTQDVQGYCIATVIPSSSPLPDDEEQQIIISHHLPSKTNYLTPSTHSPTSKARNTSDPINISLMDQTLNDKAVVTQNLLTATTDRWDSVHLPAVTARNPLISVSDDGQLLVVYEQGGGHSFRYMAGGGLYVFSLDDSITRTGGSGEAKMVQPWPYLLDIVDVDVDGLKVAKSETGNGTNGYTVTATALNGQWVVKWCLG
ncbi:F-box protein [Aspergillus ruber CBS 135680]|uniref:F-box domain-containing protein n=1 Tax=Aspergillus ruber (strain CBS 135680) TaxID=1388766 RepID=A0A017SFF4_ASPRC|nr:uncharacterized protein EURHEDRAFT_402566 [Aspergillus ruber CBS 135680]EYE95374.1 hypothetical protein EURHEDRAFT_402566 [Aspergillus ruber CBS 135680]